MVDKFGMGTSGRESHGLRMGVGGEGDSITVSVWPLETNDDLNVSRTS